MTYNSITNEAPLANGTNNNNNCRWFIAGEGEGAYIYNIFIYI